MLSSVICKSRFALLLSMYVVTHANYNYYYYYYFYYYYYY